MKIISIIAGVLFFVVIASFDKKPVKKVYQYVQVETSPEVTTWLNENQPSEYQVITTGWYWGIVYVK